MTLINKRKGKHSKWQEKQEAAKKIKKVIITVSSGSSVIVICDPRTLEAEGRKIKSSSPAWAIQ